MNFNEHRFREDRKVMKYKSMSIDPLLLSATPILTYSAGQLLTNATGFFFQRESNLFLVTSLHVFHDEMDGHFPDRIQITFHTDASNITQTIEYSIPLYQNGVSQWVAGLDSTGNIDVAVIVITSYSIHYTKLYDDLSLETRDRGPLVSASAQTRELGYT